MRAGLACDRGTASVEAVVLLPIFVLLFVASLHFYQLGKAKLATAQRARACAWSHALAGCPGERPAACAEATRKVDDDSKQDPAETIAAETEDGHYDDFTSKLGFLGPVVEGFLGEAFETQRSAEVPKLMQGAEKGTVASAQVLLCNPSPPSFKSFIRKIFNGKDKLKDSKGGG